jgi:drug/metabolite transporter (DMT)-like permease
MTTTVRERGALAAFIAVVILGGGNGVAVRFSDHELAPLWGAAVRFGLASVVLIAIIGMRRLPIPRGSALTGSLLYGLFGFAGAFGFIYYGLVATPAGLGQIILALVPLLTLLLAVLHGLERFRWQGLVGSLIAMAGIAVVFGEQLGAQVPLGSMLAIVAAAACMAESNVVAKRYPGAHPIARNAVAMGVATLILVAGSVAIGEAHLVPTQPETWVAIGYVSVIGSVAVFSLFLYVISRWPASSASYVMLLMPLVTVVLGSLLDHEAVTPAYAIGGALVLGGVYIGAFAPPLADLARRRRRAARPASEDEAVAEGQPAPSWPPQPPLAGTPGCA